MSYESEPGFDVEGRGEVSASEGVEQWFVDSERARVAGVIGGRGLRVEGVRSPTEDQERSEDTNE